MSRQPAPLERLRIASPCAVSWDSMGGDERVRHCRECGLNVYNLSAMTRREAESLISSAEGRLCARLYRRPDGTVLTDDCPVGWRAVRARASLRAAAALTALLSLFGVAAAQGSSQKQQKKQRQEQEQRRNRFTIRRERPDPARAPLSGKVLDPIGANLFGAAVTLTDVATKERRAAVTDDEGVFAFAALPAGTYDVRIAATGFVEFRLQPLTLKSGEAVTVEAILEIGEPQTGIVIVDIPDPSERVMKIDGVKIRYDE